MRAVPLSRSLSLIAVVVGGLLLAGGALAQDDSGIAVSIELPGSIDPATEAWISGALEEAADDGAELAIIRLDTPGGLDTSMREIVKDVIAAPMPVVVYVFPNGARAASAGLFVTQAADVAAMAPQTNIGSASPISITGADIDEVLGRKIENDAAAYVTALAEEHGRNAELAEEMVRDATNVSASEALEAGLIDVIAGSEEELLAQLDGFVVKGPKAGELDTTGLEVEERNMPLQYDILQLIVNPNVAFLLILAGILGLAIELFSPGLILPGALGLVSFVVGLYGSAQLPVTAAGIILLVVGVGLIIAEAQLPTGGIVGHRGRHRARDLGPDALRHGRGVGDIAATRDRRRAGAGRAAGGGRQEGRRGAAKAGVDRRGGVARRRGGRAGGDRPRRPGVPARRALASGAGGRP